jgi:hypothetical protein
MALRLKPEDYLRTVTSIMEEGPPELPQAMDLFLERSGFGGRDGILRLAGGLVSAPPVHRSSMASEKL